jgi:DNA-binding transcriptional ArsR family regulator
MNIRQERLNLAYGALADPTRRAILARLRKGDATVMELAKPFALNQSTITKHLQVLERAGLISRGRDAQRRPCHLEPAALQRAAAWLLDFRQFWEASFDRLDGVLAEQSGANRSTRNDGDDR